MTSPSKEVKVPSDHSSTVHSDNLLIISDAFIIAKDRTNVFSGNSEIFLKNESYLLFRFCRIAGLLKLSKDPPPVFSYASG